MPTQHIFVFLTDLRTNINHFTLLRSITEFYSHMVKNELHL